MNAADAEGVGGNVNQDGGDLFPGDHPGLNGGAGGDAKIGIHLAARLGAELFMEQALDQAREGRLHILDKMGAVINVPKLELSEYAPRYTTLRINPEKIRDVIGKGGVTIRSITEETGATIDITDDGVVKIAAVDKAAGDEARRRIEQITADVEVGQIYEGKVVRIMDFGAFVAILPGRDGMVHISQICEERVQSVSDKLAVGDVVRVRVLEIDKQGRVRLSMKGLD